MAEALVRLCLKGKVNPFCKPGVQVCMCKICLCIVKSSTAGVILQC